MQIAGALGIQSSMLRQWRTTLNGVAGHLQEPRGFGSDVIPWGIRDEGWAMRGQAGFFDVDERLNELSAKGDDWPAAGFVDTILS